MRSTTFSMFTKNDEQLIFLITSFRHWTFQQIMIFLERPYYVKIYSEAAIQNYDISSIRKDFKRFFMDPVERLFEYL